MPGLIDFGIQVPQQGLRQGPHQVHSTISRRGGAASHWRRVPQQVLRSFLDPVTLASASAHDRRADPLITHTQVRPTDRTWTIRFSHAKYGPVGLGIGPQIARFRTHSTRSEATPVPERTHPKSPEITTHMNTRPAVTITNRWNRLTLWSRPVHATFTRQDITDLSGALRWRPGYSHSCLSAASQCAWQHPSPR